MPRYIYTAKSHPDKIIQSSIEAESIQDAVNRVTDMGYFPLEIEYEKLHLQRVRGFFSAVPMKDIVQVTYQLARLSESGVNILNSLNIIAGQTGNRYLKAVIEDIRNRINEGKSLSESLESHRDLFSGVYAAMIRAGETGGNLELSLKQLAEYLEREEGLKHSVRSALTYPFFVFVMSVVTIAVLFMFVIPRLIPLFTDMDQVLPLPTRILLGLSSFFRVYWWLIGVITGAGFFIIYRLYSHPQGRFYFDKIRLRFPVLGAIFLKNELSRMTRTLSLLLAGGIPIVTSLGTAASVMENTVLKKEAERIRERITSGSGFFQCLNESDVFSPFVKNMVRIGEETGSLEKSLLRIADDYEKQVNDALKVLIQLLEPSMILVMGLVVGFIVLSLLLPIFQLNAIVK
ncbi:MAG: type II secretion system F family protein [Candidatus Omnitrophica bacterium]|nr:type II secretion system F family protein [Candidatus Omnitrophota bacterium]